MVKIDPPTAEEAETVERSFSPSNFRTASSKRAGRATPKKKRSATPAKKSQKKKKASAADASSPPKPAVIDIKRFASPVKNSRDAPASTLVATVNVPAALQRALSPPRPEGYEEEARDATGTAEPTRARSTPRSVSRKKTKKASNGTTSMHASNTNTIFTTTDTPPASPRTPRRFTPKKKRAVDLSPKSSATSPSKVRQARRERTLIEAYPRTTTRRLSPQKKHAIDLSYEARRERTLLEANLDRVKSKSATYDDMVQASEETEEEDESVAEQSTTTNSSIVSDESSVINRLAKAKERYERMLAEKRRRKAKQVKKLRKASTSKKQQKKKKHNDLVSLHSEHRVETVVAAAPTTTKKKKKKSTKSKSKSGKAASAAAETKEVSTFISAPEGEDFKVEIKHGEGKDAIFRSDKNDDGKDAADDSSIEIIDTGSKAAAKKKKKKGSAKLDRQDSDDEGSQDSPAEENFTEPVKKSHRSPDEAKADKKSLASNVFQLATKSADTEATPPEPLKTKLEEYEAKLHALEKFLKANGGSSTTTTTTTTRATAPTTDEECAEDSEEEHDALENEEEYEEEDSEDEFDDIEDISYDEDCAARLLLEENKEEEEEEARNEEQVEAASSGEREQVESSHDDCSNFCYWFFCAEEEANKPTEQVKQTLSIPEEPEEKEEEIELSSEELIANLARRMAMDAVLPKKKVSKTKSLRSAQVRDDDDDISVYGRVEASAFVSRDVRMERAARRAIAAKVLTEKLLSGYSTVDAEEDVCPCKKCGNHFLINEASTMECVVCPAIKSDLTRVTKQMMLLDPQHQVKSSLEAELRSLRKRAVVKERIAEKAVEAEAAALMSKHEAQKAHEKAEQAAADAEIDLLMKNKELRQIRDKSRDSSQKARSFIEEALLDKNEAKRKAKMGVRTAENACVEADYQHLFAVKETALAELKIFIADEAVRQAIEARNQAVANFQDMKRCTAKLKSEADTKQVEKAWAVAGASMLLSRKETDIKTRQAMREEAELKAVELANAILLEKNEAERVAQQARESLAAAEGVVAEAEKSYLKAHKEREAIELVANDIRSRAEDKKKALEEALTDFNSQISQERFELKSAFGKSRTDAMELAAWDEQARVIFESGVAVEEEIEDDESLDEEEPIEVSDDEEEVEVPTTDDRTPLVNHCKKVQGIDEEEASTDDDASDASPDIVYTPSIEAVLVDEQEADDSLAKDSWNFYHEVCALISSRWKYEEAFRQVQLDPLYPYLNFCSEVNCEGLGKAIMHKTEPAYKGMTTSEIATDLQRKAEVAQPHLVDLIKPLAKSLKISKIGVGPVKELESAFDKADKKYGGNLLQVTDFCRIFVVVKDIATLLALFEMVHKTMADRVCRIKFATLKKERKALPGGYRDCKINLLVQGHICEVQVHLLPLWSASKLQGYDHYQKSIDYSIDNIKDPYRSLKSISNNTLAKLVDYGTEALSGTTLDTLDLNDEEHILDYFALAGIYLRLKESAKAEALLVRLTTLRSRTPGMGPLHSETLYLKKNLEAALRVQKLIEEADVIAEQLVEAERRHREEADDATASLWEFLLTDDVIVNSRREEEELELDEQEERAMIASKNQWIQSRDKIFKSLKGTKRADAALSILNEQ